MIYRISIRCVDFESCGYHYATTQKQTDKYIKTFPNKERVLTVKKIKTPKTKQEIIDCLNTYGGHPDNG